MSRAKPRSKPTTPIRMSATMSLARNLAPESVPVPERANGKVDDCHEA